MFTFIFISLLFAINFFSAENLVTVIVGGVAAFGLTQWIKNQSGAMGFAAMCLAIFISIVVAIVAVVASTFLSSDGFSWERAAASALQVFAVATIAYKAIMADNNGSSN